jgi:hypothetical protein
VGGDQIAEGHGEVKRRVSEQITFRRDETNRGGWKEIRSQREVEKSWRGEGNWVRMSDFNSPNPLIILKLLFY